MRAEVELSELLQKKRVEVRSCENLPISKRKFFDRVSYMTHRHLFAIAGTIWFAVGFFLLQLAMSLFSQSILLYEAASPSAPLMKLLAPLAGVNGAFTLLFSMALAIGYFKGRYILKKTAQRTILTILDTSPASLRSLFNLRYALLVGVMACLGIAMRWLSIPVDLRALIDAAVGSALIFGALHYFKAAKMIKTNCS